MAKEMKKSTSKPSCWRKREVVNEQAESREVNRSPKPLATRTWNSHIFRQFWAVEFHRLDNFLIPLLEVAKALPSLKHLEQRAWKLSVDSIPCPG
jgi:hypothetical protein